MSNTTNYGIIGCGMMGREHLANIALLDGARVAAIFEPDAAMATQAAQIAPGAAKCASLEDLLAVPELDCLLVASPNHVHVAQFEHIAKVRPLPMLMEKPLFTDPNDAQRIANIGKDYPAPVWIGMEYRYMPPIAAFLDQSNEVTGGITMLSIREHRFPFLPKVGNWNRFNRGSGGTLVEKCCHFFDLMRLILSSEPVRVMASGGQDVNHLDEVYDGETPDIWDAAYVIVDFANGSRAMLELCMYAEGSEYQEEVSAVGPLGKIEAKIPGPTRYWAAAGRNPPVPKVICSPRNQAGPVEVEIPVNPQLLTAGDHNGSTFYQHQRFIEVVRGGKVPEVTLSDGLVAVKMGLAAEQSAKLGKSVSLY